MERKRKKILNFIRDSFDTPDEFVLGLTRQGLEENLILWGIDILTDCPLTYSELRKVLIVIITLSLEKEPQ